MFPNGNSIHRSPSGIKCFQNESVLPEEENYKDCHLEYSSEWSRIVDIEGREPAKAGEL